MARKRNLLHGKRPFCADCGSHDCHVVNVHYDVTIGHVWLCGSCEMLRDNPEAKRGQMPNLPSKRKVPLQKKRLFDSESG